MASAALCVALSGLAGCSVADRALSTGADEANQRALALQGADDYVDYVASQGYPSYDYVALVVQEQLRRGDYERAQLPCLNTGPPIAFDVREVKIDGQRAAVIGDKLGALVSFWLIEDGGRYDWLPTQAQITDLAAGKAACG